jgi:hypothetical protein
VANIDAYFGLSFGDSLLACFQTCIGTIDGDYLGVLENDDVGEGAY